MAGYQNVHRCGTEPNLGWVPSPQSAHQNCKAFAVLWLQGSFQKLIKGLQSLDYSILDVNGHRWHDDYNKFKAGVKDLEVMLTNVIQLGFDNASSLVARIELLEVCSRAVDTVAFTSPHMPLVIKPHTVQVAVDISKQSCDHPHV